MGKYSGKRLLMVGSNTGAADMVEYARENGAYTIVADYYEVDRSAAKKVCDEAALVSTREPELLKKLAVEKKVDGITCGINEVNGIIAQDVAEQLGMPYYFTKEQWERVQTKDGFRTLCDTFGVPCPKTYFAGVDIPETLWATIQYPAVIKPVDAATSSGVHICETEEELREAMKDSYQCSTSGRIIVEQFVKGGEFTAHYTIANGKAKLACVDNRYPVAVHEGNVTTIPVARLYPCLYLDEYIRQVNDKMIDLCEGIGLKNGILFIQGMYDNEKNEFNIFEAGLRSAAEYPARLIRRVNGVYPLSVLVDQSLNVVSDYDLEKEDPTFKGKCCGIVSFVSKGGTVGAIQGLEEAIAATPSVIGHESRYPVGSVTPNGDTLRQLMIRFVMVCDSREQMARDIQYLNEHITVLDDQGRDMVIKMDPKKVFELP